MKRKTPFMKLDSIYGPARKVEGYKLTDEYENQIKETLRWYETLIKKRDDLLK